MTELEKKEEEKTENCGTDKISIPEKICQRTCRICSSGFIEEIHDLRKSGRQLDDIVEIIKKNHGYVLSSPSLSRHFKNYREFKTVIANEKMKETAIEEASEQARHTKKIISLIDKALDQLETRANAGLYNFDIGEAEKLFNIRHKILAGDTSGKSDLVALFQKMETEFGLSNQLVLLKPGN